MSLLYGFKAWRQNDEGQLESLWGVWPGKTFTATCGGRQRQSRCKNPPSWDCTCGIYAFNDLEQTYKYSGMKWRSHGVDGVLGLLALSGRVIGHKDGMRAQHAEMVALWAVHNHDQLAACYGVEVLVDPFEFQRRCDWLIESERRRDELS